MVITTNSEADKLKNKESNMELLRLFSMFLIIIFHFSIHGVGNFYSTNTTFIEHINSFFNALCGYAGKTGTAIFILITGYYMINSSIKIKHAFRIYLYTLLYSLLFLGLSFLIGSHKVNSHILNISLFPLFGRNYWFISDYIILYLLIPFINSLIKTLNRTQLLNLILFLTVIW